MTRAVRLMSTVLAFAGCLPVDTRRPPGELYVSVQGNQAMAEGIPATADGWAIHYERFLATIGRTWPATSDCEAYSHADYDRIVDARRTEPQKLAVLYAEGRCGFAFAVTPPSEDSLVTPGVSEDDKAFLRESGTPNAGIAMHVEGFAVRGQQMKRFSWSFGRFTGYYCSLQAGADRRFVLREDHNEKTAVILRGEALFELDKVLSPGTLRFDPFAAADDTWGDGDGEIASGELERATSTDLEAFSTLRAQLEGSLFPGVAVLERGPCDAVPLNDTPPDEE